MIRIYQSVMVLTLALVVFGQKPVAAQEPTVTPIKELNRETPVDFEKEILPILRRNCLACHNNTDAESDMVLETPESILKGGASGPTVVPGDSAESLLLQVTTFASEPIMPPEDNDVGAKRLDSHQLGLLKLWIDQGAKGSVAGQSSLNWQPLPPGVNPVYAVAMSPDGQFVAAGRANQIFLYHLPTQREIGRLTDPQLMTSGVYDRPGVAHLDLVQALKFSPDSYTLASGGYRTVKVWRRSRTRKFTLADLGGQPSALATSPDGQMIAVGLDSGSIALVSGMQITNLAGHQGGVRSLHFDSGGTRLLSASLDGTIRRWELASGSTTATLQTPSGVLAMVPLDEGQFATGGEDHLIRIWRAADLGDGAAEPVRELSGHSGPITALARIAENGQLVSGSGDGTLRVWDPATGKQVRQLKHGAAVEAIAVRADGTRLASAGKDKQTILWGQDGKQIAKLQGNFQKGLQVEVAERALAVAKRRVDNAAADLKEVKDRQAAEEKNSKTAAEAQKKAAEELAKKEEAAQKALADKDKADKRLAQAKATISTAETEKGQATSNLAAADKAIASATAALAAAKQAMADATSQLAAAEASRQTAEEIVTKNTGLIKTAQAEVKAAEEAVKKMAAPTKKATDERDAAKRALESAERTAARAKQAVKRVIALVPPAEEVKKVAEQQREKRDAALERAKQAKTASQQPFQAVAFSADGAQVATGDLGQNLGIWDAETGAPIHAFDKHRAGISAVTYSSNGDLLAASTDGSVAVWDPQPVWSLDRTIGSVDDAESLVDRVTSIDFSPDGKFLATGSGEPSRSGQLKIWSLADGSLVREISDAHSDTIQGLEYSPDGKWIASSGADRFAKVFDAGSGQFVRAFEGHTHHVLGVTWRADGRLLATSGADNVVKVWRVKTGEQTRTITGFSKEVTAVRFLAATDQLVASSGDSSIQVKNANNGGRVRSLSGAKDFMYGVSAAANGKLIVAGGQDSVVRVWKDDGKAVVSFEPPQE